MKALIDYRSGRICQLEADADIFPVDPRALVWVDAPDGVTTDHTFNVKDVSRKEGKKHEDGKDRIVKATVRGDFVAPAGVSNV